MTNPISLLANMMVKLALEAVKERTDPLIDKVNAGEGLTHTESHQVLQDIHGLTNVVIESHKLANDLQSRLDEQDKEIATMKALLGLSDSAEEGTTAK